MQDNDTVIFETIDKELLLTREWQLETLSFLRSEGNDSVDENPGISISLSFWISVCLSVCDWGPFYKKNPYK